MSGTTLALPLALALIVSGLGCSPEVPAAPTYTKDVQPIFAAHCVRCHDEDLSHGLDPKTGRMPVLCHLNRFENTGDCSNAATCSNGAGSPTCFPRIVLYTADNSPIAMPPAPSDPLNDWEQEVIRRWGAVSPPAP
jgi:hypothetical protein